MPRAWQPAGPAAAVATLLGDGDFSLSIASCGPPSGPPRRRCRPSARSGGPN